jgi:hypothetical protein
VHYFLSGRAVKHRNSRCRSSGIERTRSEKQKVTELKAGELLREEGIGYPVLQRPWRKMTLVQAVFSKEAWRGAVTGVTAKTGTSIHPK